MFYTKKRLIFIIAAKSLSLLGKIKALEKNENNMLNEHLVQEN